MYYLLCVLACSAALASMPAPAAGEADRLLDFAAARSGPAPSAVVVADTVKRLLATMKAPDWARLDLDRLHEWELMHIDGDFINEKDDFSHAIVIASGGVRLRDAGFTIVIASGDVEIVGGGAMYVVSGGSIRYRQSGNTARAGVFVAKGAIRAPWAGRMLVHARRGTTLDANSLDVFVYNSTIEAKQYAEIFLTSGPPLFDGERARMSRFVRGTDNAPGWRYVGQRCPIGIPDRDLAEQLPKRILPMASCGVIDLVIVRCERVDRAPSGGIVGGMENLLVKTCGNNQYIDFHAIAGPNGNSLRRHVTHPDGRVDYKD